MKLFLKLPTMRIEPRNKAKVEVAGQRKYNKLAAIIFAFISVYFFFIKILFL